MKEESTYLFSSLNGLALKMRFSSCGSFWGAEGVGGAKIEEGNEGKKCGDERGRENLW